MSNDTCKRTVMFVGKTGVGKYSLMIRILASFNLDVSDYIPDKILSDWKRKLRPTTLCLAAGPDSPSAVVYFSYSHVIALAFCFAVDDFDSLKRVFCLYKSINAELKTRGETMPPVVLVGCKVDLRTCGEGGPVSNAQGRDVAVDIGARIYHDVSASTCEMIDCLMSDVKKLVANSWLQEAPILQKENETRQWLPHCD